jgi:glycosyltransferase involved in cell wall biosynthesis
MAGSEAGDGTSGNGRGLSILVAHPSPDLYGSDRVLLESVSGLLAAGHRVEVTLPSTGPLVRLLEDRGATVTVCPSPVLRKSALRPAGFLRLLVETARALRPGLALVRRTGADVVLVNTVTIPLWLLIGRLRGRRVVCHVHEAEGSQPAAVRRLLYLPLLLADRLVINSRFSRDVLVSSWKSLAARTHVIYNGVPGPSSDPQLPRSGAAGDPQLLFLGRLSPRKGPEVAIRAVAELRSRGIEASIALLGAVFPGYEWFESELTALVAELGLEENVAFLGFDPDIWHHLEACDVVVVPSVVDEPFGNTAVEAILALRPLVVSATSGLREAAEGYAAARFVAPGDSTAIADAVGGLLADWPEVLAGLPADRERALLRHSAQVYGTAMAAQVTGVTG